MARFNMETADKYNAGGNGGFFSLQNDKDNVEVRFMYNDMHDIEEQSMFVTHKIQVDGKERHIDCLRQYNEPVSNCPLCQGGYKINKKIFLYVYDIKSNEIKIWERGNTFASVMASRCARSNPLVSSIFEIERNGAKGDIKTTYEVIKIEDDGTLLEDLPELPPILGGLVLDKTYEEIEEFLNNGEFPSEQVAPPARNPEKDQKPSARKKEPAPTRPSRPSRQEPQEEEQKPTTGRRTPPRR
jgi:hypothetical protein